MSDQTPQPETPTRIQRAKDLVNRNRRTIAIVATTTVTLVAANHVRKSIAAKAEEFELDVNDDTLTISHTA